MSHFITLKGFECDVVSIAVNRITHLIGIDFQTLRGGVSASVQITLDNGATILVDGSLQAVQSAIERDLTDAYRGELENIASARAIDFRDDSESFRHWAQSRARWALKGGV